MNYPQMTSNAAPAQQQGAEPARRPAPEARREAKRAGDAPRPAPQQMQAATPTQFTDWAAI